MGHLPPPVGGILKIDELLADPRRSPYPVFQTGTSFAFRFPTDELLVPFDQFLIEAFDKEEKRLRILVQHRDGEGLEIIARQNSLITRIIWSGDFPYFEHEPRIEFKSEFYRDRVLLAQEHPTVVRAHRTHHATSIICFVVSVLAAINTEVVVEEVVDNRKTSRRGKPVEPHERKFVKKRYILLSAERVRQRWHAAPGNGPKKCPHLRRAHRRCLADGRRILVRACRVHEEDFAWCEHARQYKVVSLARVEDVDA